MRHPFIDKPRVVGLHQLKTAVEFFIDPACDVAQACGREATAITKATIDRQRIMIFEMFNDHIKQSGTSKRLCAIAW